MDQIDSIPWFTVHELSLFAYYFNTQLQTSSNSHNPNHIPTLDQNAVLETIQPYMLSNELCIVKNIDKPLNSKLFSSSSLNDSDSTRYTSWPTKAWSLDASSIASLKTPTDTQSYFSNPFHNGFVPPSHLTAQAKYPQHPPSPIPSISALFVEMNSKLLDHLSNTCINFNYFLNHYGNAQVSISDCLIRDVNSQYTQTSTLDAYIEEWLASKSTKSSTPFLKYCRDFHLSLFHHMSTSQQLSNQSDTNSQSGMSQSFYTPPLCVSDDYLNLHWDLLNVVRQYQHSIQPELIIDNLDEQIISSSKKNSTTTQVDDYRFVYFGPHSSYTPLHRDVYSSYSWSGNVLGTKLWIFLPPNFVSLTQSEPLSSSVDVFDLFDENNVKKCSDANQQNFTQQYQQSIRLQLPQENQTGIQSTALSLHAFLKYWITTLRIHIYGEQSGLCGLPTAIYDQWVNSFGGIEMPKILLQSPGDLVFVPSFWAHQVINLTDCISINHNWGNAFNLILMAKQLVFDTIAIKAELDEYKTDAEIIEYSFNSSSDFLPQKNSTIQQQQQQEQELSTFITAQLDNIFHLQKYQYKHYHAINHPSIPKSKLSILESYHKILSIPFHSILKPFGQFFSSMTSKEPTIIPHFPSYTPHQLYSSLYGLYQLAMNPKVTLFDDLQTEQLILIGNSGMNLQSLYSIMSNVMLFNIANILMLMQTFHILSPFSPTIQTSLQSSIFNFFQQLDLAYQSVSYKDVDMFSCNGTKSSNLGNQIISPLEIVELFIQQNLGYQRLFNAAQVSSLSFQLLQIDPSSYLQYNTNSKEGDGFSTKVDPRLAKLLSWPQNRIQFHFDAFSDVKFYGISIQFDQCSKLIQSTASTDEKEQHTELLIHSLFRYLSHSLYSVNQISTTFAYLTSVTDFPILSAMSTALLYSPRPSSFTLSSSGLFQSPSYDHPLPRDIQNQSSQQLHQYIQDITDDLYRNRDNQTAAMWTLFKPFQSSAHLDMNHLITSLTNLVSGVFQDLPNIQNESNASSFNFLDDITLSRPQ